MYNRAASFVYYAIYKPYGMLSQFKKEPNADYKTLADLDFVFSKDVYPLGRLDADSEGLLLLSNDGSINNKLLQPEFGHRRTYFVQLDGAISDYAISQLKLGIHLSIDGKPFHTLPAEVYRMEDPGFPARNPPVRVRKSIPTSWISLSLNEGKNRQVRRMTAAVGFPTIRLVRWKIEQITLSGMLPGQVVEFTKSELFHLLGWQ
jgi:23S rRNA pseudouridine2457 synthase